MKKEKIKIVKYENVDDNYSKIIALHLSLFDNKLRDCNIYLSDNYHEYFSKTILNNNLNFVYVAYVSNNLIGFIHYKIINDNILFLNNISVDKEYLGLGIGSTLLLNSLNDIDFRKYNIFQLDVFQSNVSALNWYANLGLNETSRSFWYKVTNRSIFNNIQGEVLSKDINGFDSVYLNNIKVATIINQSTILLHDHNLINSNILNNFKKIVLNSNLEFNDLDLLEVSLRYSCFMSDLKTSKLIK